MSTTTTDQWSIVSRNEDDIRRTMNSILKELNKNRSSSTRLNRRSDRRAAYPHLVKLTPVEDDAVVELGEPVFVVGKNLAERGFDFFHTENLPFRRAIVSLQPDAADSDHPQFLLNLSWSRFLAPGWYDSGGRFSHVLQMKQAA